MHRSLQVLQTGVKHGSVRLLDAVHFRCLNARGTLLTVQKALPLLYGFR